MRKISLFSNKGFTLTEIMIVVAVVGLLATIAVPNFLQARQSARRNACINNLRLIEAAKDHYAIDSNQGETVTPTAADISPYFKATALSAGLPKEPEGGSYTIGAINTSPTCDAAASLSHTL